MYKDGGGKDEMESVGEAVECSRRWKKRNVYGRWRRNGGRGRRRWRERK